MNIVLSYGDLSRQTGFRTRVLGELLTLDCQPGIETFLLAFDRNPSEFEKTVCIDVPYRVFNRSAMMKFYPAMAGLARQSRIGLVHAHNLYSAALALSARWLHGYKVILDYHGRVPEEYMFLGKGGKGSQKVLEALERWVVRNSDHVIAVSQKLADYVAERYGISSTKMSVIPCCADQKTFTWEVARRESVRRSLNVSDKLVCAHVGSFFEWYEPQLLVRVFNRIRSRFDAHLLVVSSEMERIRAYLAAHLAEGSFTVVEALHRQIPDFLNASDLGLLLLRSAPNIKTSSPAKFSEYLNCGLPVLITPDVGDFSALIEKERVGAIVREDGEFEMDFLDRVIAAREDYAARCSAVGRRLTWEAYRTTWSEIIESHGLRG